VLESGRPDGWSAHQAAGEFWQTVTLTSLGQTLRLAKTDSLILLERAKEFEAPTPTLARLMQREQPWPLHGVHPHQTFAPPANALTNC
jgi:hypothetical protein